VTYVTDYASAMNAAESGTHDAIVVGLHFAGSTMLTFVRRLRSLHGMNQVPIVCTQALPSRLSYGVLDSIRYAALAFGAQAFIHFDHADDGPTRLRAAVAKILLKQSETPQPPPHSSSSGNRGGQRPS
jgi:hypothetical protein